MKRNPRVALETWLASRLPAKFPMREFDRLLNALLRAERKAAADRAVAALDNCTHPNCVEERNVDGYSTCAGGHLARTVRAAIERTEP